MLLKLVRKCKAECRSIRSMLSNLWESIKLNAGQLGQCYSNLWESVKLNAGQLGQCYSNLCECEAECRLSWCKIWIWHTWSLVTDGHLDHLTLIMTHIHLGWKVETNSSVLTDKVAIRISHRSTTTPTTKWIVLLRLSLQLPVIPAINSQTLYCSSY